jgi:type I restriction enzyme M protein
MQFGASPEDEKRIKHEVREVFGRMEDIINKYKKDDKSSEEDEA